MQEMQGEMERLQEELTAEIERLREQLLWYEENFKNTSPLEGLEDNWKQ